MNIYDTIISFETAKLAKEKGFKYKWGVDFDGYDDSLYIDCPTQSLLQKWLREEHNIHIDMYRNAIGFQCNLDKAGCGTHIRKVTDCEEYTYEQALEQGLQEALKLIK